MGLSMFSAQTSPIAIDFGSSSVKLLQISGADSPVLVAAAEVTIPDASRESTDQLLAFYSRAIPRLIQASKCKGKRVVCAVPSGQTMIQHMQLAGVEGVSRDDLVKAQLQTQMGWLPENVVVRALEVAQVHQGGQSKSETICFAVPRDIVMQYVDLMRKCKLELVGVDTEVMAMVRAFDHQAHAVDGSDIVTMYVDLGWGGTKVAMTHNEHIVFARHVQIGGRHFDQHLAAALHCDLPSARAHRLSLQASGPAAPTPGPDDDAGLASDGGPAVETATAAATAVTAGQGSSGAASVDLSEQLDMICDELSMCLRYHQGLFPNRSVDRVIFIGGEARQKWLCQHVMKVLGLKAQLGDPLARLGVSNSARTPGLIRGQPQPGWAVPCGLCTAPTDL